MLSCLVLSLSPQGCGLEEQQPLSDGFSYSPCAAPQGCVKAGWRRGTRGFRRGPGKGEQPFVGGHPGRRQRLCWDFRGSFLSDAHFFPLSNLFPIKRKCARSVSLPGLRLAGLRVRLHLLLLRTQAPTNSKQRRGRQAWLPLPPFSHGKCGLILPCDWKKLGQLIQAERAGQLACSLSRWLLKVWLEGAHQARLAPTRKLGACWKLR